MQRCLPTIAIIFCIETLFEKHLHAVVKLYLPQCSNIVAVLYTTLSHIVHIKYLLNFA